MMIGFVFWTVVAIAIAVIGIIAGRSKKPSGFFAGVNPPEVNDVEKYNHSVGTLLGVVFASIGLAVAYTFILAKYRK